MLRSTSEANQDKSGILEKHSEKISEETNSAREDIAKDKVNAGETLKPQIISLAHLISSKVLGEEIPISGISIEMIDKLISR